MFDTNKSNDPRHTIAVRVKSGTTTPLRYKRMQSVFNTTEHVEMNKWKWEKHQSGLRIGKDPNTSAPISQELVCAHANKTPISLNCRVI